LLNIIEHSLYFCRTSKTTVPHVYHISYLENPSES